MRVTTIIAAIVILAPLHASAEAEQADGFTSDFPDDQCDFRTVGGNAYFPLRPGLQRFYDNNECVAEGECAEQERLQITVTHRTKRIKIWDDGVKRIIPTRVIEEREWQNGRLVEVSYNYFAACGRGRARDVYYFGEAVYVYEYLPNGEVKVTHPGAWLAGRDGAEPGIIMPGGAFLLGSRYYQELAPGVALDRAEHVALDLDVETEAGDYEECVEVVETTPFEPGEESSKLYCPNVGLVTDDDLVLTMVIDPEK
jgi:hypothetical protein